jgi:hypothetical protein
MLLYPVYKAIKQRLSAGINPPLGDGGVFYYIGQYLPGKENTSYKVPAIYIELPKDLAATFLPQKLMHAKDAIIKVHYVSYAPFKNHDNEFQEAAVEAHETKLNEIDALLHHWHVERPDGKPLTQQLLNRGGSFLKFQRMSLISVVNYKTEIYGHHLQSPL